MTRIDARAANGSGASASGRDLEFTLDRNWRITSISKGAAAWSGFAPEDLVGRSSREVWPPEPRALTEAIEAAFAGGASSTVEHPSLAIPGRWVKVDVDPSKDGARLRFEDITSRASFGPGPAEIALLDRNGVIVAVNAAWRAGVVGFGLKLADDGVGSRYAAVAKSVAPKTDEVAFQNRLEELFSGRLQEFEATFTQDEAGLSQRRQVRITPLQSGDATYFMAVHENLTERARILAALHETSGQLLHAQEKERERIAIELHDTLGQNQAAMVLGLVRLRKRLGQHPAAQAILDDMSRLVEDNVQHTRVLSYLMNASGGQRVGLEASLRRLVDGFGRRAGLEMTFSKRGPVDAISAAAQHAVFRVVQEALSNVYRHARAEKVSVKLVSRTSVLTVYVADDGRGFQLAPGVRPAEPALGVGIAGMRSRIEQLGGTLEIVAGVSGTSVTASVPLRS
ncbi:MAG TPA: PAS domain-containing protein [Caulobacteraceae bacterium]